MGVPGLLGLTAWSFYVLVLAVQPHQAHSSIRGSFGLNKGAVASPENGLCASSVTVHGYKCEEHEVNFSCITITYIIVWLVIKHKYSCELTCACKFNFQVTTKDGYILSVQRIPEGRVGGSAGTKKQPVLIQHGVAVVSE